MSHRLIAVLLENDEIRTESRPIHYNPQNEGVSFSTKMFRSPTFSWVTKENEQFVKLMVVDFDPIYKNYNSSKVNPELIVEFEEIILPNIEIPMAKVFVPVELPIDKRRWPGNPQGKLYLNDDATFSKEPVFSRQSNLVIPIDKAQIVVDVWLIQEKMFLQIEPIPIYYLLFISRLDCDRNNLNLWVTKDNTFSMLQQDAKKFNDEAEKEEAKRKFHEDYPQSINLNSRSVFLVNDRIEQIPTKPYYLYIPEESGRSKLWLTNNGTFSVFFQDAAEFKNETEKEEKREFYENYGINLMTEKVTR